MVVNTKTIPPILQDLRIPVIGAPMFTVSYPELVKAQCKSGIVGSFPALNARTSELLDDWLTDINAELDTYKKENPQVTVGPIAVNLIIHRTNPRLQEDLNTCVKHKVPIIITSLMAPVPELIEAVHSYGGIVLHDVINVRHAKKAIEAGVDGLILVAAGAGGHGGTTSPLALVGEVKKFFSGPIILSGAISTGDAVLAAQVMGADFAYIGTKFIASEEARAVDEYKQAIVNANAADIVYTDYFSGVHGNYLKESVTRAGLELADLDKLNKDNLSFVKEGANANAKTWKDIWGAGQGVGLIDEVLDVATIVDNLENEYQIAVDRVATFKN